MKTPQKNDRMMRVVFMENPFNKILEKHFLGIQSLTVLNENISVIVQIFVKEIYRVLYTSTASGTVLGLLFSILCGNGSKNIAK